MRLLNIGACSHDESMSAYGTFEQHNTVCRRGMCKIGTSHIQNEFDLKRLESTEVQIV